MIVPSKHVLAVLLSKNTASALSIMKSYEMHCNRAPYPTDSLETAKVMLEDLIKQMKERHVTFDITDLPLNTAIEVNIARRRLEDILVQTDALLYADKQKDQRKEITEYMALIIAGGGGKGL